MSRRILRWPSVLGLETQAQMLLVDASENTTAHVDGRELKARIAAREAAREARTLVECKSVSGVTGEGASS